jgi:hypothetical protein
VGTVHKKAFVEGSYKLIVDDATGSVELYDLRRDPAERSDLAAVEGGRLDRLRRAMQRQLADARAGAFEPRPRRVESTELERLKSLGYVGD